MQKKFYKQAYDIEYYGEHKLNWFQKLFYNPPRNFKHKEYRTSRNKAEVLKIPEHKQFNMIFDVASYSYRIIKG